MKVVGRGVLDDFCRNHADVVSQLGTWLCEVQEAEWSSPRKIKLRFPHASILSDNCVIFNVKGNRYRIETKINYAARVVLVKRIGTHAEYSKWTF
jgi:mRNA interferase HigB